MRKVSLAQASRPLAKFATELTDEIVVVTKGRRAVAALVPLAHVDPASLALSTHPEFLALIKAARAEIAAGRTVSVEAMRKRVLPRRAASDLRSQRPVRSRRR